MSIIDPFKIEPDPRDAEIAALREVNGVQSRTMAGLVERIEKLEAVERAARELPEHTPDPANGCYCGRHDCAPSECRYRALDAALSAAREAT